MSDALEGLLRDRLGQAPSPLRDRMMAGLEAAGVAGAAVELGTAGALAARLRMAAGRLLLEASERPASPDVAVSLLASDGLATLACEVLAEGEPGVLAEG